MEKNTSKLLYASGEKDADIYYATGVATTDPYIYLENGRKKVMFANTLEFSRAKKNAKCKVELLPVPKTNTDRKLGALLSILKKRRIAAVSVPYDFPTGLAQRISSNGVKVSAVQSTQFFAERAKKTEREIKRIAESQEAAQQAIELAIGILAEATPDKTGKLVFENKPLTSEYVQSRIAAFLAGKGIAAGETIVSSGPDTSMPHARGSGAIRNNAPVILDIFPQDLASRYHGDVTRTVFKGNPTTEFVRMYQAVQEVQQAGLDRLREGAVGVELYKYAVQEFEKRGYKKTVAKQGVFGFNHGLGHGLGLDVHEEPWLNPIGGRLEAGNVVTVEPGLYYPKIGGVRIEDLVVVTKNGHRNLTRLSKELQVL